MISSKFIKYPISFILLGTIFMGCFQSDYTKMVKAELAKGIRKDSVLLGIYLGESRNDFYGKCFDLNKQQIATEGAGYSIQYLFTDSLVHKNPTPIKLLFVPAFDDKNVITNIDLNFSYQGWSPWNEHLFADTLKTKMMDLLMHWYGGNKFVIANVDGKEIPVKVDGNRRILVYVRDEQSVVVRVQDILHPKYRHSISAEEVKK